MNLLLSRFHNPARHAAQQLNEQLGEIADGVRNLRTLSESESQPEKPSDASHIEVSKEVAALAPPAPYVEIEPSSEARKQGASPDEIVTTTEADSVVTPKPEPPLKLTVIENHSESDSDDVPSSRAGAAPLMPQPVAPGVSRSTALQQTSAMPELPGVIDLRPALAAFVAATKQQQEMTMQAFQQVMRFNAAQQNEMARLRNDLDTLERRVSALAQRL